MKIEFLGTHSPFATEKTACPSYFISNKDDKILFDCGSGSHRFFDMRNLDGLNIFISHLHKDHFNDIFNYLYASYAFHNLGRLNKRIKVYLPKFPQHTFDEIVGENLSFAEFFEITENSTVELQNGCVTFCKVEHSPDVLTLAMKYESGKKITYSADMSFASKDKFANFAKDSDLLICESSLLTTHNFPEICNHLTARQAGKIAMQAGVEKLVLTHFWGEEDLEKYLYEARAEFNNTILATEKLILEL